MPWAVLSSSELHQRRQRRETLTAEGILLALLVTPDLHASVEPAVPIDLVVTLVLELPPDCAVD